MLGCLLLVNEIIKNNVFVLKKSFIADLNNTEMVILRFFAFVGRNTDSFCS